MSEKIEIEKPIVSEELAEAFEMQKNKHLFASDTCNANRYVRNY